MEHIKKYWNFYLVGAIILIWAIWFRKSGTASPTTTNGKLANCLKSKGAKFYGASWCPHCIHQKALFGSDAGLLPYIECSNPDKTQTKVCNDANITGYPTWVFADGTKIPGEMTLSELKQKAGC